VSASVLYISMSLDGCIAGPSDEPGNPGGDGFDRLHARDRPSNLSRTPRLPPCAKTMGQPLLDTWRDTPIGPARVAGRCVACELCVRLRRAWMEFREEDLATGMQSELLDKVKDRGPKGSFVEPDCAFPRSAMHHYRTSHTTLRNGSRSGPTPGPLPHSEHLRVVAGPLQARVGPSS